MKKTIARARLWLCGIIVLAFFLPAYGGYSAFSFIPLAFSEAANGSVTKMDIIILIVPLLLIPAAAVAISGLFLLRISVRRIYLAVPVIFLVFFLMVLFRSPGMTATSLRGMQLGFYTMVLATACFAFTKDAKRKSRRRVKRTSTSKPELAA